MTEAVPEKIVFFDGVCGLCNGFVDFVLPRDRQHILRFSPLQSDVAADYLPPEIIADLTTIVFYDDGSVYLRSEAVIRALSDLGAVWSVLKVFLFLPAFIRDGVYRRIAANRYKWFGEKDTCRVPTPEERSRFI